MDDRTHPVDRTREAPSHHLARRLETQERLGERRGDTTLDPPQRVGPRRVRGLRVHDADRPAGRVHRDRVGQALERRTPLPIRAGTERAQPLGFVGER